MPTPAGYTEPKDIAEGFRRLNAVRDELHKVFAEADVGTRDEQGRRTYDYSKVKTIEGDRDHVIEVVGEKTAEMNDLAEWCEGQTAIDEQHKKLEAQLAADKTPASPMEHPAGDGGPAAVHKSLGEMFVESKAFKELSGMNGPESELPLDFKGMKTLFERDAGWSPEPLRTGRVELDPQRPIAVINVIPSSPTTQNAVKFMEETTFTPDNVVEKSEGSSFGEPVLALTERSHTVEKIPAFLPVTDEQLEDVEGVRSYIDNRLRYMIQARLDYQITQGDGNTPNLEGTVNVSGINTQALGSDVVLDTIHKGMRKVRSTVGFADPSVLLIHPTDWEVIRLLKTGDGVYIMGSPTEVGPLRVWGVPVLQTTAVVENTAVVGDYQRFSELRIKRGLTVKISDSHSDYFIKGKQAIRVDMRCAMVHYRPEAFCTLTGI